MKEDAISRLEKLKKEIEETFGVKKNVWFFPEGKKFNVEGVKGYLGTQNIMFVGLNPSMENASVKSKGYSPSDNFLYTMLREYGFQNAHITDFLKVGRKNKEINEHLKNKIEVETNLKFLRKEIDITNPKIIVTMGRKCESLFKKYLVDIKIPLLYLWHYSYVFRGKKKEAEKKIKYSSQMKKIKEKYEDLTKIEPILTNI